MSVFNVGSDTEGNVFAFDRISSGHGALLLEKTPPFWIGLKGASKADTSQPKKIYVDVFNAW